MAFVLSKATSSCPAQTALRPSRSTGSSWLKCRAGRQRRLLQGAGADGDIVPHWARSDKAVQDAADKPVRKKKTADWDKPAEPQED